jgi:exosortase
MATVQSYVERTAQTRDTALVRSGLTRSEQLRVGMTLLLLAFLYAPTVSWLIDRWSMSVWHHAHGFLIPPLVAYFVALELRNAAGLPRSSSAWGFAIVAPALLLHALDAGMHTQILSAASLVLLLPGLSLLLLGSARTRRILFPLAFAAFMLPIPLAVTENIHLALRHIAANATDAIVQLAGIPVFLDGTTIHMPEAALLVGDACSGFSTLYAAAAVACMVAYANPSTWRRVLVLASAAPLAIAANIVRVTSLVLLVHWRGEGVLGTFLHPLSGMMTFALALPLLFWIGQSPDTVRQPEPTS